MWIPIDVNYPSDLSKVNFMLEVTNFQFGSSQSFFFWWCCISNRGKQKVHIEMIQLLSFLVFGSWLTHSALRFSCTNFYTTIYLNWLVSIWEKGSMKLTPELTSILIDELNGEKGFMYLNLLWCCFCCWDLTPIWNLVIVIIIYVAIHIVSFCTRTKYCIINFLTTIIDAKCVYMCEN